MGHRQGSGRAGGRGRLRLLCHETGSPNGGPECVGDSDVDGEWMFFLVGACVGRVGVSACAVQFFCGTVYCIE
jgi:hypothetical protein